MDHFKEGSNPLNHTDRRVGLDRMSTRNTFENAHQDRR